MNRSRRFLYLCAVCSILCVPPAFVVGDDLPPGQENIPDAAALEFFEARVRPLLIQHCYECHSQQDVNGGLRLDTRDGVIAGGDSGPVVTSGDPDHSLLIEAVRYKNRDLQMPPKNPLSAEDIAALERWVRIGLPDPREETTSTVSGPTGMSIEEGRRFWSMRPVVKPDLPPVRQQGRVQTPVDAFLLARLESAGLVPAARADKRTLIRRATFDLIGLPPTPDEVDSFLADDSPEAFARVVDRLLESPQYGVRWGRHWLDVARYADSNGLDENLAYGHAWRYRDYVVNAFNTDKPFDRFLIEQLAGDLIPAATQETRTATGFLALGAKVLAEPDMDKLVMDTIDEQLDTTGKAFMGLTLGCVRCHDHKFDPLKQTDYYALAAIFKSTRTFADTKTGVIKHWFEHSFSDEAEQQRIKEIENAIAEKKSAATSFKNKVFGQIRETARNHAADYLAAAARFPPDATLAQITAIAQPRGLHPRILQHCRIHLSYHTDEQLFQPWHAMHRTADVAGIAQHYSALFARVRSAWTQASTAGKKQLQDPQLEAARRALHDNSGFLAVPPKVEFAFDPEPLAEFNRLSQIAREFESAAADTSAAMGVSEQAVVAELPIHIRGSHLNLGPPVPREFPAVLRRSAVRPIFPAAQSGRLELAQWMASTQHPLTARVFVNRVWGWHFGVPLVSTTENFGKLGSRPTHPALLDWLAHNFMEHGWRLKPLHRQIMLSAAWQMSALSDRHAAANTAVDPQNALLWKFRLQRLEAEQIRDAILKVAGQLDETIGGKSIPLRNRQFVFNHTSEDHTQYTSLRRALYLPIVRNNLYTQFAQFDFPDPTMPTGHRSSTVVAPQALWLMNSELVINAARAFAARLAEESPEPDERIDRAWQSALARQPSSAEIAQSQTFLHEERDNPQAWALLCQSLFAGNEFIYLR